MRVLVVEDDENMRLAIAASLRGDGFAVDSVASLPDADRAIAVNSYDCVVFDRLFPGGDALNYVRGQRSAGWLVPVIFVSALDEIEDQIAGLAYGDYVVKPFAMAELLARVRAMARPMPAAPAAVKTCGDLELDTARRDVRRGGVLLTLTPKEFAALDELLSHQGAVVSQQALTDRCWDDPPEENSLHKLIAGLRRKLRQPEMIHNVRGEGYRIAPA